MKAGHVQTEMFEKFWTHQALLWLIFSHGFPQFSTGMFSNYHCRTKTLLTSPYKLLSHAQDVVSLPRPKWPKWHQRNERRCLLSKSFESQTDGAWGRPSKCRHLRTLWFKKERTNLAYRPYRVSPGALKMSLPRHANGTAGENMKTYSCQLVAT